MRYNNEIIGLFPLRLFLLEGESTKLHIYEPKYLQLISDCLRFDQPFGIPYQSRIKLHEYGSIVRVKSIGKKYKDGSIDVIVECVQNFKVKSFEAQKEGKLYPAGEVQYLNNFKILPNRELVELAANYYRLLFNKEIEYFPEIDFSSIINLLSLEEEEKLKLFKYPPNKKVQFLIHKLKYMSILVHKEKLVEHQYHLN